nr:MAG TPA: putative tail fiber protein [Caudoviricetes sp.]
MAIIKNGRINLWNAVKKQFEVVHPETEVERITDFADGIVLKLALTSAMTAVTALQTDSWFGKLLKMVLKASGVRYNIANNGYICFGSFFGGLIIQWGLSTNDPGMGAAVFNYPVTFNPFIALAGATGLGVNNYANDAVVTELGTTACTIDSTPAAYASHYRVVVIGRN